MVEGEVDAMFETSPSGSTFEEFTIEDIVTKLTKRQEMFPKASKTLAWLLYDLKAVPPWQATMTRLALGDHDFSSGGTILLLR